MSKINKLNKLVEDRTEFNEDELEIALDILRTLRDAMEKYEPQAVVTIDKLGDALDTLSGYDADELNNFIATGE